MLHLAQLAQPLSLPVPSSCCHPGWRQCWHSPGGGQGAGTALLGCRGCLPHLKETQTHLVPIPWSLALIWGQLCRAETTSSSGCSFPGLAVSVERMGCAWRELHCPSSAGCSPWMFFLHSGHRAGISVHPRESWWGNTPPVQSDSGIQVWAGSRHLPLSAFVFLEKCTAAKAGFV